MALAETAVEVDTAEVAPSPAVAPPPGNPRFPLIDSVRAIAVLVVLIYHVFVVTGELDKPVLGDLVAVGGVQAISVLFMTSGFLLYRPFVRARAAGRPLPSRQKYLRRRMLRILPAYWFALTVLAIYPGITGVFTHDWWRFYFFLQLYSNRTVNIGIPVAWTLCVEMSFYLTLPLWATMIRRVRVGSGPQAWLWSELIPLALAALVGIVIQVLASRHLVSYTFSNSLLGNGTWIALGMALAVLSVADVHNGLGARGVGFAARHAGAFWAAAAICLAAATLIEQPGGIFHILLSLRTVQPLPRTLSTIALTFGVCVFVMSPAVFGVSGGGITRRVMAWPRLMWIGLVSYGVYLWHLDIVSVLGETSDPVHFSASGFGLATKIHHLTTPILLVLTLGVSLAIAAVSYYFVELPFLRRKEG